MQAVGARGVGGGELDELVDRDAALEHAFRVKQWHAGFEPGDAVGNIGEGDFLAIRVLAFGATIVEGRMVR